MNNVVVPRDLNLDGPIRQRTVEYVPQRGRNRDHAAAIGRRLRGRNDDGGIGRVRRRGREGEIHHVREGDPLADHQGRHLG